MLTQQFVDWWCVPFYPKLNQFSYSFGRRTIVLCCKQFIQSVASLIMSSEDIERYYQFAHTLVLRAGQVLREGYGTKNVTTKTAHYDQVTEYDNRIEDLLFKELAAQFPGHKFIGEETSAADKSVPELTNHPTWIIDPIDGTANFIKKIPHTCISVGLAINKELVMGIIYNPIQNEMFTASKGNGAFLNGERIRVSNVDRIQDAIVAYEISLLHEPKYRDKNVKRSYKLGANATGMRSFGCAALSLCYVAMGRIDCYHIDDMKPWDMAAGAVIIREAGGVVYHTSGSEFQVMKPDIVCAATESLSQDVVRLIREAEDLEGKFL